MASNVLLFLTFLLILLIVSAGNRVFDRMLTSSSTSFTVSISILLSLHTSVLRSPNKQNYIIFTSCVITPVFDSIHLKSALVRSLVFAIYIYIPKKKQDHMRSGE